MTLPAPSPLAPMHGPQLHRLSGRAMVTTLFAAIVVETGIRVRHPAIGGAVALAATTVCIALGYARRRAGMACATASVALSVAVALRSSPWLVTLDVIAALGLCLALTVLRPDAPLWIGLREFLGAAGEQFNHVINGHSRVTQSWIAATPKGIGSNTRRVAAAAPIVIIVGVLLMSADKLFASFFRLPVDPGGMISHIIAAIVAAAALAMFGAMSVVPIHQRDDVSPTSAGSAELLIALRGIVVLLAGFTVTQVIAAVGGQRFVEERTHLTHRQYARQGFFQLLAVATIVLILLGLVRRYLRTADLPRRRHFLGLGIAAAVLTLAVIVSAIARLRLYQRYEGLTMLRLYSMTFAGWLALVVAIAVVGLLRPRATWILAAAAWAAIAGVSAMNVVNPTAMVVRHYRGDEGRVDPPYLLRLSDDAVPALVATLDAMHPDDRNAVLDGLCERGQMRSKGVLQWNLAQVRANAAIATVCG